MKSFEKSDAKNHRPVGRGKSRHSLRPMGYPEVTGLSKMEPGLTRGGARAFVEDFYFEHSSSGLSITRIAISASSDFVVTAAPRNPRAYDLNSPNCVYIG